MSVTSFPGGIAQYVGIAKGGSAGSHSLSAPVTIATDDLILSVQYAIFGTNGAISTINDLTSEFSCETAGSINNTGGTATTGALLIAMFADISAGE
jgi:hypothetical protein